MFLYRAQQHHAQTSALKHSPSPLQQHELSMALGTVAITISNGEFMANIQEEGNDWSDVDHVKQEKEQELLQELVVIVVVVQSQYDDGDDELF